MFGVQICDVFFWKIMYIYIYIYSLFKLQGSVVQKWLHRGFINSTTHLQIIRGRKINIHPYILHTLIDFQITQGKLQFKNPFILTPRPGHGTPLVGQLWQPAWKRPAKSWVVHGFGDGFFPCFFWKRFSMSFWHFKNLFQANHGKKVRCNGVNSIKIP